MNRPTLSLKSRLTVEQREDLGRITAAAREREQAERNVIAKLQRAEAPSKKAQARAAAREHMAAARAYLHERLDHLHGKPLAIGAGKRLIDERPPELPPYAVAGALKEWTGSFRYLRALVTIGQRYELDGAAAGEVTPEHRAHAAARLKKALKAKQVTP